MIVVIDAGVQSGPPRGATVQGVGAAREGCGMRVLVVGRMEREPWEDKDDKPRETWQINARSVGILPYRIESVTLSPKPTSAEQPPPSE